MTPESPLAPILDAIDWLWDERMITLEEHRRLRAPIVARQQIWFGEYAWAKRQRKENAMKVAHHGKPLPPKKPQPSKPKPPKF